MWGRLPLMLLWLAGGCAGRESGSSGEPSPATVVASVAPPFWFEARERVSDKRVSGQGEPVACAPIGECMRGVAASGYHRELLPLLNTCAGLTPRQIEQAGACFPLALGVEHGTGLALWAALAWPISCLDHDPSIRVFYGEVGSPDECACVGGAWWNRACEPKPPQHVLPPQLDVRLNEDFGNPLPAWFEPAGPAQYRRRWLIEQAPAGFEHWGLGGGDAVVEIGGQAVTHPDQVVALLLSGAARPPTQLVVEHADADRARTLYFIDRESMHALAQRLPTPNAWDERLHCANSHRCFTLQARIDARWFAISYDPTTADGVRWASLAGEIIRTAESWRAPFASDPAPIACAELRSLPTALALSLPDESSVELRYVAAFARPNPLWTRK